MLGFEPPLFGDNATLGGTIASGLAGPSRPFRGSVRDFVLGVKLLSGKGEIMQFGGQVMKNVAGFDVSRLMAGALGVLGVILEVSVKVLPKPEKEVTLRITQPDANQAIAEMNKLCARPLPISAASWFENNTRIRLSGSAKGVESAKSLIGGEVDPEGDIYWWDLKEHRQPFFLADQPVIRASVAPSTPFFENDSTSQLIDWAGGVRWALGAPTPHRFIEETRRHDGHITFFRNGDREHEVFESLSPEVMKFHRHLKTAFDPDGLLNPGRLYKDL